MGLVVYDCKTQMEFIAAFAKMWKKEFDKCNDYLSQYNMRCYTFTDEQLQDPDACFLILQITWADEHK